ncbi:unnamed protein product [Caenorhabditis auriculariae]|uniref:Serpentine receptor class gamma n=1 Tax=Caenorhabditis auriculariae TaxID=2777116 RepID=A0A8S1H6Y8_9PELO|nr:unnamed protein product [Caenorhabditis auriculariae]
MNYLLIVLIQLTYIVPSLLLYGMICLYIVWSRDPEFRSAFHRLFLARAPADVVQVLTSVVAFRLPLSGWQACLSFPLLAKLGFVVSQYATLIELCAQLILSANRLTAIAFPIGHKKIWSRRPTFLLFGCCAVASLIPTLVRIPQPAGYLSVNGSVIPYLINDEDQKQNSLVSCCLYVSFCAASLSFNIAAVLVHSKQRRMQLFETQQKLAAKVQTNLLIYSCIFTVVVISMTICQCLLALDVFPLRSQAHNLVIVLLTVSADAFALSNPWLLFCLSGSFRKKFLEARRFPKLFPTSTTGDTS